MKWTPFLVAIILVFSSGCQSGISDAHVSQTGLWEVEYGKLFVIEDDRMIKIDSVFDGRCPSNVICCCGGWATVFGDFVSTSIEGSVDTSSFHLTIGSMPPDTLPSSRVLNGQYTIELLSVEPYPFLGINVLQEEYRCRFRIEKI